MPLRHRLQFVDHVLDYREADLPETGSFASRPNGRSS
jgi:hypothetical protein